MATSYSVFKAKFKKTIADAIIQEITSKTARYYHWFGKENSWMDFLSPFIPSNPTTDAPGEPSDNFRYDLHVRRDILTAKLIKPSDVSYVVRRIDWEVDTVYDMYDDAYDKTTGYGYGPAYSGATRLEDSNFYVLTSEYNIYKCIWNADDTPSTVMPTGTTVDVFETSDGYKWKFMYTIPVALRNRFLTSEYMPVTTALRSQYFSNGAIERIAIENGGSGYNPDPLVTVAEITGDGTTELNPYKISDISLTKTISGTTTNEPGYGYATPPEIVVSEPYPTAVTWTASAEVALGGYIKHYNPLDDKTNYYKIVSGTKLGTAGPVHDTPGETINNGSTQLKYVGTRATGVSTIDTDPASPTYSQITDVNLVEYGFGYPGAATVTIASPLTEDITWDAEIAVANGDIVKYESRFYEVIGDGQLGTTAPTSDDPLTSFTNGDVDLLYIGEDAHVELVVTKTEATVKLIITPGTDSVFTIKVSPTNPGSKYAEPPSVAVSAPETVGGATATAEIATTALENGSITGITVVNPGNGYIAAPTITISNPHITITPSDPLVIDSVTGIVNYNLHRLLSGDEVEYDANGGDPIDGLTDGGTYYIIRVDANNFQLAASYADATAGVPIPILIDGATASADDNTFTLTSGAAAATSTLGTGGEIVDYIIEDGGVGYTNCNITVTDLSKPSGFDGGAVLVADFAIGDVDTVQANVELLAVWGSIEAIKVVDGGSGYGAADVVIRGDGNGAEARAICAGGRIIKIEITKPGQGYTWTDVQINGNTGSTGAAARAIMSPLGGHGSNAIDELNANSIVFYSSISRDKNQGIEITNNDYHKAGLIRNLKQFGSNNRFTDDVGSGCVLVSGYTIGDPDQKIDITKLEPDMLLYKDETPDDDSLTTDDLDYKKYRIVEYNENQILLSVFNNFTISKGDVLRTDPSNIGRVPLADRLPRTRIKITSVSERTIDQFSGDFLFFSVRESYAPTADQIVTIRTTLTL